MYVLFQVIGMLSQVVAISSAAFKCVDLLCVMFVVVWVLAQI